MWHKHRIFINIKKDVIRRYKMLCDVIRRYIYLPFGGAILPPPLTRDTTLFT